MRIKKIAFIFLFAGFIGLILSCKAQEPAFTLVLENELTGTDIYSILQDSSGDILLTTDQGFMRYDGYQLQVYGNVREKTKSLFGLRQSDLGQVWCFNLSGQIFEFKQDSLHLYFELPDTLVSDMMMISPGPKGDLFVSCGHVVMLKPDKTISFLDKKALGGNGGSVLRTGPEDFLCLEREGMNARRFASGKWETVPFADSAAQAKDRYVRNLFQSGDRIYMKSDIGFEIHSLQNNTFQRLHLDVPPAFQKETSHLISYVWGNQLWLTLLRGGILRFDEAGKNMDNGKTIFSDYKISGLMVDREGSIWLPTLGSGILLLSNPGVIHYQSERTSAGEKVRGLAADLDGNIIWATSEGNVFRCRAGQPAKLIGTIPGMDMVYLNHENESGKTYFGTKTTLVTLESDNGKTEILSAPNYSKGRSSYPGNLAVLPTTNGIFFTCPPTEAFPEQIQNLHGFQLEAPGTARIAGINRSHCALYEPESGDLYVGSAIGLQFVNESGIHDLLWKGQQVIARSIVELYGSLWISSSQFGLLEAKNGRLIRRVSLGQGLHSNAIRKVVTYDEMLFLAMDKVIQVYNPYLEHFEMIDLSDGLSGKLIVDFVLSGSTLWVAYQNGIRAIPLDQMKANDTPPLIRITEFRVNGDLRTPGSATDLAYSENQVEFQFVGSGFRHQNHLRYAFRLLGANADWQMREFRQNFTSFSSLGPGNYTFQVKAINEDGVESLLVSQQFRIAHPFWLTWWFISLCIVVTLGIMVVYFQSKIRRIRQKNALQLSKQMVEKELVDSRLDALRSQMNPHFIFNALNSIQDFILSNEKKLAAKYLGKFADLMRIYLNHSQKKVVLLSEELEALAIYLELEKLRFQDNLVYEIEVPTGLDPENFQIPSLVVQPFVENAIKHGLFHKMGERKLWVRFFLSEESNVLICEVEDNGIGREAAAKRQDNRKEAHNPHATASTRSRLELLNLDRQGDIGLVFEDLVDENGMARGTKVILKIPLNNF